MSGLRRRRQRGRGTTVAVVLTAMAFVVAGASAVGSTQAKWTDAAYVKTSVSAGNWVPAGPSATCSVRQAGVAGPVPGRTCTLTYDSVEIWNVGAGWIRYYASSPGIANDEYIVFTITPPAGVFPGYWNWPTTGMSLEGGTITSTCHDYPSISGRKEANRGDYQQVYVTFSLTAGCA